METEIMGVILPFVLYDVDYVNYVVGFKSILFYFKFELSLLLIYMMLSRFFFVGDDIMVLS